METEKIYEVTKIGEKEITGSFPLKEVSVRAIIKKQSKRGFLMRDMRLKPVITNQNNRLFHIILLNFNISSTYLDSKILFFPNSEVSETISKTNISASATQFLKSPFKFLKEPLYSIIITPNFRFKGVVVQYHPKTQDSLQKLILRQMAKILGEFIWQAKSLYSSPNRFLIFQKFKILIPSNLKVRRFCMA